MNKSIQLLIVDDSAMMRAVLRRAVTAADPSIVIHEAANGLEAILTMEREHIDAVFTDINMPVMSGIDLLREMQTRAWHHIQSVVISTDGTEARHTEARDLNVRVYLTKPFSPDALQRVLDQLSVECS